MEKHKTNELAMVRVVCSYDNKIGSQSACTWEPFENTMKEADFLILSLTTLIVQSWAKIVRSGGNGDGDTLRVLPIFLIIVFSFLQFLLSAFLSPSMLFDLGL